MDRLIAYTYVSKTATTSQIDKVNTDGTAIRQLVLNEFVWNDLG